MVQTICAASNIRNVLNQPLSGPSLIILMVVLAAVIFLAITLGHKKARDVSRRFLAEHPEAATLYFYSDALPSNDAKVECVRGTASKVYDPRTAPGAKVQKGAACHILPGAVELNVTISWTKSYYVAREHRSMQAHFAFEAAPGRSYAAAFNPGDSTARISAIDAER